VEGIDMKSKIIFSSFFILVFVLSSCGQETIVPVPVTQTPIATQLPTDIPTQIATPTLAIPPSPTVVPPYPTASVVKSDAVAFLAWTDGKLSLWVVNVDGSGERKLTAIENNIERTSNYLLKWSPDGKWISYISGNDLWVISPDRSTNRKVIEVSEADNKNKIWSYSWSPDGSEIAYIQTIKGKPLPRLLNLETGDISSLPINTDQLSLSWSPDGRYILLNAYTSLTIFEVAAGKILEKTNLVPDTQIDCPIEHGGVTWSPNSKWLYYPFFTNGTYGLRICLSGLDGSVWHIEDVGWSISQPVWDKTGDYLYFIAGKMDLNIGVNWFTNQRLLRYNVKARKVDDLLSLEEDGPMGYPPIIFLSPNGQMLGLYSYTYREDNKLLRKQNKFLVLDTYSLSIAKHTLVFEGELNEYLFPTWSPDNENIIFLSETDGCFYKFDVHTDKKNIISGEHSVEYWSISPIATTP
jgi:Tol biopolymer transport system component